MIYALPILLVALVLIAFFCSKKDLVAPSVIFIAGFVYCAIWACIYAVEWGLTGMQVDTFWVVLGGAIVFLLASIGIRLLFERKESDYGSKLSVKDGTKFCLPDVKKWFMILSICFMAIALFASLSSVIQISGGSWLNIGAAIKKYNDLSKFSEQIVSDQFIITFFRLVASALTYWFTYVFISKLFAEGEKKWRRIDILSGLNVVLGMFVAFSTGGRGGAVNVLIAAASMFVVLYFRKHGSNMRVKIKWALPIIALFLTLLALFPKINIILGRGDSSNTTYYLAIYSGAEIKNLDIFLNERANDKFVSSGNNQTFAYITNTAMKAFHFGAPYKLDIPFRNTIAPSGERLSLGNVYTTYYQFIYDYGFFGVLWCTALMAIISQFVYEKCRRSKMKNVPNIYILMYGYMASSLLLSFFSNKFYEQNFNKAFIFDIVFWIILNFLITKGFYLHKVATVFAGKRKNGNETRTRAPKNAKEH